LAAPRTQAELAQDTVHILVQAAAPQALQAPEKTQIFLHGQLFVQPALLRRPTYLAGVGDRICASLQTADQHAPGICFTDSRGDTQQGALARPVRTCQRH
jgi:hypothetical protein